MTPLQTRLITILRKRVNLRGVASASYAELAYAVGPILTAEDVRAALIELRDDGFFMGKPILGEAEFSGKLPR